MHLHLYLCASFSTCVYVNIERPICYFLSAHRSLSVCLSVCYLVAYLIFSFMYVYISLPIISYNYLHIWGIEYVCMCVFACICVLVNIFVCVSLCVYFFFLFFLYIFYANPDMNTKFKILLYPTKYTWHRRLPFPAEIQHTCECSSQAYNVR